MSLLNQTNPKVFISYSWDNEDHKLWVRDFAVRLRKDGIEVTLDRWHVGLGAQLPAFMEGSIREDDYVIIVCTTVRTASCHRVRLVRVHKVVNRSF